MLQVIDPSVTDEADPFSVDPALDMYDPDNGWRPWPEPAALRPRLAGHLPAAAARPGRAHRRRSRKAPSTREPTPARQLDGLDPARHGVERRSAAARCTRATSPCTARWPIPPTSTPRSTPTTATLGTIFASRIPARRQLRLRRAGPHHDGPRLAVHVVRAVVGRASWPTRMPAVTVPTLVVHPTADTEIRLHQARAVARRAGSDDVTYVELAGAPHYLSGHRREAVDLIVGVDDRARPLIARAATRDRPDAGRASLARASWRYDDHRPGGWRPTGRASPTGPSHRTRRATRSTSSSS